MGTAGELEEEAALSTAVESCQKRGVGWEKNVLTNTIIALKCFYHCMPLALSICVAAAVMEARVTSPLPLIERINQYNPSLPPPPLITSSMSHPFPFLTLVCSVSSGAATTLGGQKPGVAGREKEKKCYQCSS